MKAETKRKIKKLLTEETIEDLFADVKMQLITDYLESDGDDRDAIHDTYKALTILKRKLRATRDS